MDQVDLGTSFLLKSVLLPFMQAAMDMYILEITMQVTKVGIDIFHVMMSHITSQFMKALSSKSPETKKENISLYCHR